MTGPNDRNVNQQPKKPSDPEQTKKNPLHESGEYVAPKQQDPAKREHSKKDPSQADAAGSSALEGSDEIEKRRA
jgi:hypothetical protein